MRASPVREQPQLLLLDAILHLAAGAVDRLVQMLGISRKIRHNEPGVFALDHVLGLHNYAAR